MEHKLNAMPNAKRLAKNRIVRGKPNAKRFLLMDFTFKEMNSKCSTELKNCCISHACITIMNIRQTVYHYKIRENQKNIHYMIITCRFLRCRTYVHDCRLPEAIVNLRCS